MIELRFRYSVLLTSIVAAGAVAVVCAFVAKSQLAMPLKVAVCWPLAVLSCGVVLACVRYRLSPVIVIDEVGIDERKTGVGMIPWGDVRALRFHLVRGAKTLSIEVGDPVPYLSRQSEWSRLFRRIARTSPLSIPLDILAPPVATIRTTIATYRPDLVDNALLDSPRAEFDERDTSLIYIYKSRGDSCYLLTINGEPLTILRRGGYCRYEATPGDIEIRAKKRGGFPFSWVESDLRLRLSIEAGRTYYVRERTAIRVHLEEVTARGALHELADCVALDSPTA